MSKKTKLPITGNRALADVNVGDVIELIKVAGKIIGDLRKKK